MKNLVFIILFLNTYTAFGQVADSLYIDTIYEPESYEIADDFFENYNVENAYLTNKKKVFKAIYKAAKKRDMINGHAVWTSVMVDTTGKLLSVEFYGYDSIYTFIRPIFLQKAKYRAAKNNGRYALQVFAEKVVLSKEFLLGGYDMPDVPVLYSNTKPIESFDAKYVVHVKVNNIFYGGQWLNNKKDITERVKDYCSPTIKLSDDVAVYFEFPQVSFRQEKYFMCRYYIKEKKNGVWNTRCQGEIQVRGLNTAFVGGITCGVVDDVERLELKMDVSLELDK